MRTPCERFGGFHKKVYLSMIDIYNAVDSIRCDKKSPISVAIMKLSCQIPYAKIKRNVRQCIFFCTQMCNIPPNDFINTLLCHKEKYNRNTFAQQI